MSVFNSLGSNYDGRFVLRSIITPGSRQATKRLRDEITKHYDGNLTLTYKGRQALQLALSSANLPKNSVVGINGFTCFEVYQSVKRAGFKPLMIDVAPHQLNFSINELKKTHSKQKDLQAIIIQNTLGLPADILEIEKYCQKNKIVIIEDLAHSLGAQYADGREVGNIGSLVMFSFSQDKPLDVVAGGALIDRRKMPGKIEQPKRRVSLWQREINGQYPMWTALIRNTYPIGLGRYIHFGLKKLHLLATPMGDNGQEIQTMEPSAIRLLLRQWKKREEVINHRQKVAAIYDNKLSKKVLIKPPAKGSPLYLRFPIWVENRVSLIAYLKKQQIYIGDTWYDAPIGPARYMEQTDYKSGECPNAEDLAEHIVNLPTHIHVDEAKAKQIAQKVNSWLKLQ